MRDFAASATGESVARSTSPARLRTAPAGASSPTRRAHCPGAALSCTSANPPMTRDGVFGQDGILARR
jgi:hypothetical protein